MTEHIVLMGDSIIDNAAYTHGQPDVAEHLRRILPADATVTLLALDGSTTSVVIEQARNIPAETTFAVVSMGGNDAIMESDALDLPVASTAEALAIFGDRIQRFEARYRAALDEVVRRVPRTAVCTIYDANPATLEAPTMRVGLTFFNDVILRVAFESRLPAIDLRLVCTEPSDFANALEPSSHGASKIARSIAAALGIGARVAPVSEVFAATRP